MPLRIALLLLILGGVSVAQDETKKLKPGRLPSDVRKQLVGGVLAKFETVDSSESFTRRLRLPALTLTPQEPANSFLPSKPTRVSFSGYIKLKLKEAYTFSFEGFGAAKLRINDEDVLVGSGELGTHRSKPVQLVKGYNKFELTYEPLETQPRKIRVYWENDSIVREPIPPTSFFTIGTDPHYVKSSLIEGGRDLVTSHNCLKCHSNGAEVHSIFASRDAPDLNSVGVRLNQDWMQKWLLSPSEIRSDATMPHLFDNSEASKEMAANIASFLSSLDSSSLDKTDSDAPALEGNIDLGGDAFENLGCIGCHRFTPASEEDEYDRVSLHFVDAKFKTGQLANFLINSRAHYQWSRMPQFKLSAKAAADLAAFIRDSSKGQIVDSEKTPANQDNAELGKKQFVSVGCVNCHKIGGLKNELTKSPLFANSKSGCLSEISKQGVPHYSFSEKETESIRAFIDSKNQTSLSNLNSAEFAQYQIKSLRCATCHDLDDEQATLPYIIEEEGVVGLPPNRVPMLTYAGEKLLTGWSSKLLTGKLSYRVREHFRVQMPGFPTRGSVIAEGLAAVHGFDGNENIETKVDDKLIDLGKKVAAMETGLSCNRCHAIADKKPNAAFDAQSTNLIYASKRLRKEYYLRWMANPLRIDKQTKMPKFSEDGKSTSLKSVLNGDAEKQFDALWHYLNSIQK